MKEITILFITNDVSQYIEKSSTYLMEELRKHVNLIQCHEHGDIHHILKKLEMKPDFILMNDLHPVYGRYITGLENVHLPIGVMMHDLHYKISRRKKMMREIKPIIIFNHYRDAFKRFYLEFTDQMIWLPHHVPDEIFKDYQHRKEIDLLMLGSMIPNLYPFRNQMYDALKKKQGFRYHAHPGYEMNRAHSLTGEAYAREINRAKIFLTCDSIYHYPLLKYMECLACNTLLLAPGSNELEELGFKNGETFINIDETNFLDKAKWYLENDLERDRISKQGYEMVRKRHLTSIRAIEMIQHIHDVI